MNGVSGDIVVLLTAAGASRRMKGRDKLLEPVEGVPLIARQARAARDAGAPVIVTLPPEARERRNAIKGLGVTLLEVAQAAEGMAASLRAGAAEAARRGAAGLMVLPADMPEIAASDIAEMIAAFRAADPPPILRATTQAGEPGHPVIFPTRFFDAMTQIEGDRGARDVLAREASQVVDYPLRGARARVDLDTPEDWAAWRARNREV